MGAEKIGLEGGDASKRQSKRSHFISLHFTSSSGHSPNFDLLREPLFVAVEGNQQSGNLFVGVPTVANRRKVLRLGDALEDLRQGH